MATYHRQNPHANKKKLIASYEIRDKDERFHRSGVNSLQYDPRLDRLYSAGRDSVIRIWDFNDNDDILNRDNQRNRFEQPRNSQLSKNIHKFSDCNDDMSIDGDFHVQSMEHHSDWVNDIILTGDGRHLLSVSNDTTIKVWNAHKGFCLSTLRSHKDYAKCLAYAKDKEILASGGFDRMIYIWDVQVLSMLTTSKNTVTTKPLEGSKDSIYSLAINHNATLIASGSTEKVIRLWDPRSRQKMLKFRGHTDNVRSLLFSGDGSLLLSASSDGTIRVWSIPQQRCVNVIRVHDKGVWTLQADDNFNTVFSGGKDGKVYMTDLKQTSNTALVCQEDDPVLKILLCKKSYHNSSNSRVYNNRSSIWVATSNSTIKNWSLCSNDQLENYMTDNPMNVRPDIVIKGNPAVIDYHVLNDKRHVLTRESDNSISLYDVLTARKLETIHKRNNESDSKDCFEMEVKNRFKMIYVPHWFSVDLKIGVLCIHIEENEVFSAWVSAKDYGFVPEAEIQDPKINLGRLMLQALFEYWPPSYEYPEQDTDNRNNGQLDSSHDEQQYKMKRSNRNDPSDRYNRNNMDKMPSTAMLERMGNQYFSIPPHTPIIISEGNQTILKFLACQASERREEMALMEIIPSWISDVVISKCQPRLIKIPFFLLPHPNIGIKPLKKERLTASDMLPIRKVIEHVREKMISEKIAANAIENGSPTNNDQGISGRASNSSRETDLTDQKVELYCNDQKLDENLDLRSVRHYIWKSGSDLVLHYIHVK